MGTGEVQPLVPGQLWLVEYPIRYMGTRFNARTTLIRLDRGAVVVHSPCRIDEPLARAIAELGPVEAIIAPGNYHYLYVPSCQQAFPRARTFVSPGVIDKMPTLRFDELLTDEPPADWAGELSQVVVTGTRMMSEVVFFHHATKTLIVVDLVENFGDDTPGTNLPLRTFFKLFRMWGKAAPAPEYRMGWGDKAKVRACLERVLAWDFDRVVLSHGDLITADARATVERAWCSVLGR